MRTSDSKTIYPRTWASDGQRRFRAKRSRAQWADLTRYQRIELRCEYRYLVRTSDLRPFRAANTIRRLVDVLAPG